MGSKTKIAWCDSTWNPVTGCMYGCEYCYARGIANRFSASGKDLTFIGNVKFTFPSELEQCAEYRGKKEPYPFGFYPTLHRYRLETPAKWKNPRNIFVCSMADLFGDWVPDNWIHEVLHACEAAPQHRYIFLTKNPDRLNRMMLGGWLPNAYTDKYWFGTTWMPENKHLGWGHGIHNSFVSVEPLLEPMNQDDLCRISAMRWIIVGAETGNRKGKVKPERTWVEDIVRAAKVAGKPVFMKNSLRSLLGDDFLQEFPWRA